MSGGGDSDLDAGPGNRYRIVLGIVGDLDDVAAFVDFEFYRRTGLFDGGSHRAYFFNVRKTPMAMQIAAPMYIIITLSECEPVNALFS